MNNHLNIFALINNRVNKIMGKFADQEDNFVEINSNIAENNTAIQNVQNSVDDVISLVPSEIATAKNEILDEIQNSSCGNSCYISSASSATIKAIISSETSSQYSSLVKRARVVGFEGYVNISCSVYQNYGTQASGSLLISLNGVSLLSSAITTSAYTTYSANNVYVKDGDIISFSLGASSVTLSGTTVYPTVYCNSFKITGTIAQQEADTHTVVTL